MSPSGSWGICSRSVTAARAASRPGDCRPRAGPCSGSSSGLSAWCCSSLPASRPGPGRRPTDWTRPAPSSGVRDPPQGWGTPAGPGGWAPPFPAGGAAAQAGQARLPEVGSRRRHRARRFPGSRRQAPRSRFRTPTIPGSAAVTAATSTASAATTSTPVMAPGPRRTPRAALLGRHEIHRARGRRREDQRRPSLIDRRLRCILPVTCWAKGVPATNKRRGCYPAEPETLTDRWT